MSNTRRSVVRRSVEPHSVTTPLVSPLYASVVYRAADADTLDAVYEGRDKGFAYAREGHPNAEILAEKLAWLEGAQRGVMTCSGMSAVSAVLLGLLEAGDHVLAGNQLYGRSLRLVSQELPRLGFATAMVDLCDLVAVERALRPDTRLLLVEVVANPTLRVADIAALGELAARHGFLLVVDNTFTTPLALRPLELGAHVVVHSVTKLLAGHSDVTLGFVGAAEELLGPVVENVMTFGLNASPFDCWLAERGLNTLEVRFERAQANARALAAFIKRQPGIRRVLYPGDTDHPDHALAQRLLGANPGNMLCFELEGGRPEVNALMRALRDIPYAPTLGDVCTMISHPASSSHRGLAPEARAALGISEGFIRVSVGIETLDVLEEDFGQAIAASRDG